jgi:hypothetical protein
MFCQLIIEMLLDSQWTWDKEITEAATHCLISWQLPTALFLDNYPLPYFLKITYCLISWQLPTALFLDSYPLPYFLTITYCLISWQLPTALFLDNYPLPYFLTITYCLISWQLPQIVDINDQLATRIYNKRDNSHFVNINLPHLNRDIPTTSAFRVTHTLRRSCQFIFRLFTPSSY